MGIAEEVDSGVAQLEVTQYRKQSKSRQQQLEEILTKKEACKGQKLTTMGNDHRITNKDNEQMKTVIQQKARVQNNVKNGKGGYT